MKRRVRGGRWSAAYIVFLLLNLYLQPSFTCALSEVKYSNKITQKNIHANYKTISEWFSSVDEKRKNFLRKR